ncbi:xylulokinase [Candidatus Epulonipiscium fishelsonii]|nr:xylulokinase [Epulopiscium sp. SCG-C06WGA-EpuloA1]
MDYFIGVDLGTSGTKTVLFDEIGKKISSHTIEYDLIQPQNGWAEQNPADWWNATVGTIKEVIKKSDVNPSDIKGLGISGQMHGLVMVDKHGEVLRNSIIWCDGRTGEECKEITETIGKERLIEITANPALTGFTAGKILWVRKHEPELYEQCHQILLPKDYIRYKLTGLYGAEVSDASGTNLLDIAKLQWSKEILDKLNISQDLMPKLANSVDIAGNISEEASKSTGLTMDTIVCYGAGDNASAGIGTGVVSTGKAFTTIGTSGVVFAHSDEPQIDKQGRVHTFCSAVPNKYTIMSCTLSAGLSLKWFRDNFCTSEIEVAKYLGKDSYDIVNEGVEKLPIGSDKLIFLPYLMGERSPILDENARGVFFGLSAIHTKYHMIRAIMEGVMYSQKQCLDVINGIGVFPKEMYACGGGAKSEFWRQMMADIYNTEVLTVQNEEGPALGVAILAAVACGKYKDVESACEVMIKTKSALEANPTNHESYDKFYKLYIKLYPMLKDSFQELKKID